MLEFLMTATSWDSFGSVVSMSDLVPPAGAVDWLTTNILLASYCDLSKRIEGVMVRCCDVAMV